MTVGVTSWTGRWRRVYILVGVYNLGRSFDPSRTNDTPT